MNFEALDGTKLIIFMIAGAAFAGVGLYLLLRPKAEGTAKIELFGLKFESSSAGLLVFLVGAAFMSLPLFVKEQTETIPPITQPKAPPNRVSPSDKPDEASPADPVLLSGVKLIEEVEPNNEQSAPNTILHGQRVKGEVFRDEPDWFVMLVPEGGVRGDQIMLKQVSGSEVRLEAYNAREEHKGWLRTTDGARYLEIKSDFGDRIYFKVHTIYSAGPSRYELAVVPSD